VEALDALKIPRPGVYPAAALRLEELVQRLSAVYSSGRVGAVALFMGVARGSGRGGRPVRLLVVEAYEENANLEIGNICREVSDKYGVVFTGIWHLTGEFKPGEPVVVVATAGGHRVQVFGALREAVERYKREPAIFKKEVYVDGSHKWVTD